MSLEQELEKLTNLQTREESKRKQIKDKEQQLKLVINGVTEQILDCEERLEELEQQESSIDAQLKKASELGLTAKQKISRKKK